MHRNHEEKWYPVSVIHHFMFFSTLRKKEKKISMRRKLFYLISFALFYNDADASLTQAGEKEFYSLVDEDQVDGSTNHATVGELQLWSRDPDGDSDASKGIFRIVTWQGDGFEPEA